MSVLVKGLEMPMDCIGCLLCASDEVAERIDGDSKKVTRIYNCLCKPNEIEDGWIKFGQACRSRQEWCPLVEVPDVDVRSK
jgi:hypothetical protein